MGARLGFGAPGAAGAAPPTIGRRLAAIGWMHRRAGLQPPQAREGAAAILEVIAGIRRCRVSEFARVERLWRSQARSGHLDGDKSALDRSTNFPNSQDGRGWGDLRVCSKPHPTLRRCFALFGPGEPQ